MLTHLTINMQFYRGRVTGSIWCCFALRIGLASCMVIGCVYEEDIQSIADVSRQKNTYSCFKLLLHTWTCRLLAQVFLFAIYYICYRFPLVVQISICCPHVVFVLPRKTTLYETNNFLSSGRITLDTTYVLLFATTYMAHFYVLLLVDLYSIIRFLRSMLCLEQVLCIVSLLKKKKLFWLLCAVHMSIIDS